MSQFYDQASLVMVPSGYKAGKVYSQKPLSTDGELSFSRASNATRVVLDASGQQRLEKVRTNELTQSNFATGWGLSNVTLTGGQSGYDGSSNAWLMTDTNSAAYGTIDRLVSIGAMNTTSIYAKAGTTNIVGVRPIGGSSPYVFFDLSNGTFEGYGDIADLVRYDIQGVGGGWYRCSVTSNAALTQCIFYIATTGGALAPAGSTIYIQDAQVESGDVMTDYIATTTTSVSVGPVSGLPRLDYSGGASCPSLLLEPQRTNLITFSEQLATGTGGTSPITSNTVVSPSGYQDADTVGSGYMSKGVSAASGTYTFSVFLKYESAASVLLYIYDGAYYQGSFNLQTGIATSSTGSPTVSMVSYGNGWYRCFVTATTASAISEVGFGSGSVYAYGLQLEAGAYATSYIPTLSSAVTRVADSTSKTGISSLIGQTEGTVFYDFVWNGATTSTADYPIVLSGSDFNNFIGLNSTFNSNQLLAYSGGSAVASISGADFVVGQRYKIALAYKANDFVYYVNGTPQGSDTSGAVPIGLANLQMVTPFGSKSTVQNANSILLFKTRLSNADLATLTAL